jgi:hypothetical protein
LASRYFNQPGNRGSKAFRVQVDCNQRLVAVEGRTTMEKQVIDKLIKESHS